jgi:phosphate transport system substrate-binding protein
VSGARSMRWVIVAAATAVLATGLAACGGGHDSSSSSGSSGKSSSSPPIHSDLSGTVRVDGSNIIAPLTEAIVEGFQEANPGVSVSVGMGGTGAGFEELCAGKADVIDAAWLIDERAEGLCKEAGVRYEDVAVATDALAVLINEENPVSCLTVSQLSTIWGDGATVSNWNEIPSLDPEFDEELALFGPQADSGSFEYFSEAINGVSGTLRTDYQDDEGDESATVAGVEGTPGGMGFVSFPSYTENEDGLKALEVDGGKGCVDPSVETIQDGSYVPLSRPQFLYLSKMELKKPAVRAFVDYYLENVADVAESAGFVPLTEEQAEEAEKLAKKGA